MKSAEESRAISKDRQIALEVNNQAENFYEDAVQLGDHAAYVLKARHRSQLTGLENLAESAWKVSDVLDYVKRQTARFIYQRQTWPQEAQNQAGGTDRDASATLGFGERLLSYLEKNLEKRCDEICRRLEIKADSDEGRKQRRRVHLLLIRQFIRQMVIEYEFRVSFETENAKKGEA